MYRTYLEAQTSFGTFQLQDKFSYKKALLEQGFNQVINLKSSIKQQRLQA